MNLNKSFQNRIIALAIFTSLAISISSCKKDNLEETTLEVAQTSALPSGVQSVVVSSEGITSSSYYLVNSLPSNFVKDGSVDYTTYVQAVVSKYSNIVFPGFPILVNDSGINIGSDKVITFEEGSEIRLKPSSKSGYKIFNIYKANNVTLYNPVIVGDRKSHLGTSGEWGMGIAMYTSSNITIYNAKISDCWGDGIYIGQAAAIGNCKNIVIKDSYLRGNRRDGISIIGVDGLLLDNLYAGYNIGTSPATGINFEPNNSKCELKNIRINNPYTEFNGERGIQVTGHHILNSSEDKNSDITIVNHKDYSSPYSAFKLSLKNVDGTAAKMYGLIKIVNPSWIKTLNNRPLHILTDQMGYKINISSPEVINVAGSLLSWSSAYSLLMKAGKNVTVTQEEDPLFLTTTPTTVEPLTVTEPVSTTTTEAVAPANLVFAVNAGGSSFTASNGIVYGTDKNYSKGSIYKTKSAIVNTNDDALYQTERYGNFSYAIPLSNGTYEITFKMAETYHQASGKRVFDILAENSSIISKLDIFSVAGGNNAYDLVKTVSVADGTLNLNFKTSVDNAKVSAFHIVKK